MFQALRIRDFRWLWTGGVVSALGSWMLVLAVPAHVYEVTGSLARTGLTLAAEYLPLLLLGPAAGALADRWDRRRLMIGTSLFQAAAVAAMLAALAPGRYWIIYAALAAESGGSVLFAPASQARTPAIVGTGSMLSSANALNALRDGVVRLAGGPLGGILLVTAGIRVLICADVLSYLAAAGAGVLTSRTPGARSWRPPGRALAEVGRDLRAGLGLLARSPAARALLPVTVVFLAANASLSAVLVPFCLQRLGGSRPAGFLLAALGVGYLLAAPALRLLLDRWPARYLLTAPLAAVARRRAARCAAGRRRRRPVRLHVAGHRVDHRAAGHPQRGARPGQRRVRDRRGRRHPGRRRGRADAGPVPGHDRAGRRGQPGHPGGGRAGRRAAAVRAGRARPRPGGYRAAPARV
jgi:MFS family permease